MATKQKSQNYLLERAELGHIKPGFHNLPAETHIYGKAPVKDKYNAREGK